jgi:hypothetical protein
MSTTSGTTVRHSSEGPVPFSRPVGARPLPRSSGDGYLRAGAVVRGRDVDPRGRLDAEVLVGLAMRGALFGLVYPARSTDNGGHWRISGPLLYRAAADGAAAADSIGSLPDGTVYIWGNTGNFIRASDAGTSPWYEANLPSISRVWHHGNTLLARTYPEPNTPRLFRSSDDGRTWSAQP